MSRRTKQQKSAARKKRLTKAKNIRNNNTKKFDKKVVNMLRHSHKLTVFAALKSRMGMKLTEQEGGLLAQFRTEGDVLDN